MSRTLRHLAAGLLASVALPALVGGCSSGPNRVIASQVAAGDLGEARHSAFREMQAASAENRILAQLRFGIIALADGYPRSAGLALEEVFRALREQGLNEDRTLPGVFVGEAARIWKGEPFEQALAYYAIAAQQGMIGEWGNMRSAASSSLFLLKNFEEVEGIADPRIALAEHAARDDDAYLDSGYQPIRTDFAVGYLLHAIASDALGRPDEASDNLLRAAEAAPWIDPTISTLRSGEYNTILLIECGLGPEKAAYGPDSVLTRFVPRSRSDDAAVLVSIDGAPASAWPWVCDTNAMSQRLAWRGLEDVRQLRSLLGTGMAFTGAVLLGSDDTETQLVGIGMVLAGLLTKATSRADIRSLEVFPQRIYLVPLNIETDTSEIALQIEGDPSSRVVLPLVPSGTLQPRDPAIHLVRLPFRSSPIETWTTSGAVIYANEWTPWRIPGDDLPWILGGTCVRPPTHDALLHYQQSGWLTDITLADLEELYRLEAIIWELSASEGIARGHILEGGSSLIAPVPASAGFLRIFGQQHPPYRPQSLEVRRLREQIEQQRRDIPS